MACSLTSKYYIFVVVEEMHGTAKEVLNFLLSNFILPSIDCISFYLYGARILHKFDVYSLFYSQRWGSIPCSGLLEFFFKWYFLCWMLEETLSNLMRFILLVFVCTCMRLIMYILCMFALPFFPQPNCSWGSVAADT